MLKSVDGMTPATEPEVNEERSNPSPVKLPKIQDEKIQYLNGLDVF